jgi:DNA modification methylase
MNWENCYEERWLGRIYPESICHPAKFSKGLIKRIYEHAIEEGWANPGDIVLDPFGGVALGALDAMVNKLSWIGVELEEKFVKLGEKNISYWQEGGVKGTARIIQGDSRNIKALIEKADLVVSSPPYEGMEIRSENQIIGGEKMKELRKNKNWEGYNKQNKDNMGNITGDTFWSASREIVQGCYNLLKPGGHTIWVCKDYIKKGQRIPFSNNWQALCESVGFKLVCRHKASLVSGNQKQWDGSIKKKETKSFFRRLQENRGLPKIDWEDVICMRRNG